MHKEILFIIIIVCLLLATMGASCDGEDIDITVEVNEVEDVVEYLENQTNP